jgi:hypothetical protein
MEQIGPFLVGIFAAVVSLIGAWWARGGKRAAERVDNAVNNRHEDDPKLYDHVEDVVDQVRDMRSRMDFGFERNDKIHEQLREMIVPAAAHAEQNGERLDSIEQAMRDYQIEMGEGRA